MKKTYFLYFSTYELIKFFIIISSHNGSNFTDLPVSWFASIPLLLTPIFVLILAYFIDEFQKFSLVVYTFTKITFLFSLLIFYYTNFSYAISKMQLGNQKNLISILHTLPYFLFDVIILVILIVNFIKNKKNRGIINADNTSC